MMDGIPAPKKASLLAVYSKYSSTFASACSTKEPGTTAPKWSEVLLMSPPPGIAGIAGAVGNADNAGTDGSHGSSAIPAIPVICCRGGCCPYSRCCP
mmetsp:Transcript_25135/g.51056  ORF Transcript_25135/g.51056 Transcript_25135/m.51056 type:complete len:97 (+) Transcript_25135:92-382(+)